MLQTFLTASNYCIFQRALCYHFQRVSKDFVELNVECVMRMKNKYTHLTFSPYACAAMDLPPSVCGRFPYKSHMQPEPMLLSLLIPLGVRASATQLSDFPACGFRNDPGFPGQTHQWDECLWDCEWVPNPFHRETWKIDVVDEYLRNPANPEEKVVFSDVKYFMTTLQIPKDLSCLSGCRLQEIVSFRRKNLHTIHIFSSF